MRLNGVDCIELLNWKIKKETDQAYLISSLKGVSWFPKSTVQIKNISFYYANWFRPNWQVDNQPSESESECYTRECQWCNGSFKTFNPARAFCGVNCWDSKYLESEQKCLGSISDIHSMPVVQISKSKLKQKDSDMSGLTGMMNGMGDKMMNRFFRKIDNVVWDLMTGRIGVATNDGIVTLEGSGEDATTELNLMEAFGMAIPAFAQSTPVASVAVGDLVYNNGSIKGWITSVNTKKATVKGETGDFRSFTLITPSGTATNWKPPKVAMIGFDSGVMIVRSLMTMLGGQAGLGGMQGMLLPMMMMGGDSGLDLDSMLPMMLFSQMGAGAAAGTADPANPGAANPMAQMLPMMMMMGMMKGNSSKGVAGPGSKKGHFDNY